jgi:hypothetical protein
MSSSDITKLKGYAGLINDILKKNQVEICPPNLKYVLTNGNSSGGLDIDASGGTIKSSHLLTNTIEPLNPTGGINISDPTGGINISAPANPDGAITLTAYSAVNITAQNDAVYIATQSGDIFVTSHTDLNLTGEYNVKITSFNDLVIVGAGLESTSAGIDSTQFLRIKLNGVYYKIQLKED